MLSWIIPVVVFVILIGGYVWMFFYTRKRQKAFENQYETMKERREVFVLSKKVTKERPQAGAKWARYIKIKNYHVVGRISISQAVRGVQMSRMQTVTFQTTKKEYDKIQPNHKYKMDLAGNYIGFVVAPVQTKEKPKGKDKGKAKEQGKSASPLKSFFRRSGKKESPRNSSK